MIKHVCAYPFNWLRAKSIPVLDFDEDLKKLATDMSDTLKVANGAAISAVQIGLAVRAMVISSQVAGTEDDLVCINPTILDSEGSKRVVEGCLSFFLRTRVYTYRPTRIRLRAFDLNGEAFELDATGDLAQAIAHEIDHMNGKLIVDHAKPIKKKMIQKKYKRFHEIKCKGYPFFVDYLTHSIFVPTGKEEEQPSEEPSTEPVI